MEVYQKTTIKIDPPQNLALPLLAFCLICPQNCSHHITETLTHNVNCRLFTATQPWDKPGIQLQTYRGSVRAQWKHFQSKRRMEFHYVQENRCDRQSSCRVNKASPRNTNFMFYLICGSQISYSLIRSCMYV